MSSPLSKILAAERIIGTQAPWRRVTIDRTQWLTATQHLAAQDWSLFGFWGEPSGVHMAVREQTTGRFAILTLQCPEGSFPSVAQVHSPALRLERTIRDLFGLVPHGLTDGRAWLDHGRWTVRHPMGAAQQKGGEPSAYPFLPAEGHGLHEIPVGPVHAGIIEPGVFLFTANGETVVRLEERLGYVHKGIESLMTGADLVRGSQLAGRTSGDSTVAYALAFARAAESALGVLPSARATFLRALMAELERIANHFGDFGAICNDASFALMHAECGILRERVLRAARACFGHRLMRDCVVVGGVARELEDAGIAELRALLDTSRRRLPTLIDLYENTASLLDRTVGAGILTAALAEQYACGGFVGRASGRAFDARRQAPYPPYEKLVFEVPVLREGDVDARARIRLREIEQSLFLIEQMLDRMPSGELRAEFETAGAPNREGAALVEGFRGDIFVWLRLDAEGRILRCHMRDPSWFQWPLLEAAIEGNIVADFPLCNKSFNCSYSGHDL
jgi:Ni,Fe-hydrogenase III large subunit